MDAPLLSIVIPAYNEEENLAGTIPPLQQALREAAIPYELVIVNDNSADGTAAVIARLRENDPAVRTVDRTPPGGFGRAVRSGLDMIRGEVVIIYMADASDHPEDAIACYRKIVKEGYDCVFGSRFVKGAEHTNYPLLKLVCNRLANHAIRILFRCPFNDLTNAFKAYRREVIEECGPYRASHFNITIEMSLSALIRQYHIAQIPIKWTGRTWGSSNLSIRQMGRRYISTALKHFFERMFISDDLMAERLSHRIETRDRRDRIEERLASIEKRLDRLEGRTRPE